MAYRIRVPESTEYLVEVDTEQELALALSALGIGKSAKPVANPVHAGKPVANPVAPVAAPLPDTDEAEDEADEADEADPEPGPVSLLAPRRFLARLNDTQRRLLHFLKGRSWTTDVAMREAIGVANNQGLGAQIGNIRHHARAAGISGDVIARRDATDMAMPNGARYAYRINPANAHVVADL